MTLFALGVDLLCYYITFLPYQEILRTVACRKFHWKCPTMLIKCQLPNIPERGSNSQISLMLPSNVCLPENVLSDPSVYVQRDGSNNHFYMIQPSVSLAFHEHNLEHFQ